MLTPRLKPVAATLAAALLILAAAVPAQAAPPPRTDLPAWLAAGWARLAVLWSAATAPAAPSDRHDPLPSFLSRKGCDIDPDGQMVCAPVIPTPPAG